MFARYLFPWRNLGPFNSVDNSCGLWLKLCLSLSPLPLFNTTVQQALCSVCKVTTWSLASCSSIVLPCWVDFNSWDPTLDLSTLFSKLPRFRVRIKDHAAVPAFVTELYHLTWHFNIHSLMPDSHVYNFEPKMSTLVMFPSRFCGQIIVNAAVLWGMWINILKNWELKHSRAT